MDHTKSGQILAPSIVTNESPYNPLQKKRQQQKQQQREQKSIGLTKNLSYAETSSNESSLQFDRTVVDGQAVSHQLIDPRHVLTLLK